MRNEQLIVEHMPLAGRIANSIARKTGREFQDIHSEAVYGLVQMGSRFDGSKWRSTFGGFVIYGIRSQVRRYLNTKYQEPFLELEDVHLIPQAVEHAIMIRQAHERLRRTLDRLPARDRIVIRLRYFRGLTGTETARRMGISQGRVHQLETRGLEQLRRTLMRRGVRKVADIL